MIFKTDLTTNASISSSSSLSFKYSISTGKVLPDTLKTGAPLKKLENFVASTVADERITFKSGLFSFNFQR